MEQIEFTPEQRLQLNASPCFHCRKANLAVVKENLTTDKAKFFYYVSCIDPECSLIIGEPGNTPQEAVDLWCEENDHYLKIRKELDNG